jgi:hypothetical protein
MKTGVHGGISDAEYHSCRDSLSASGAKLLLPPSCPAKFREYMGSPPKPKPEFDFGKLAHKLVLGEGEDIVEVEAADWRGKDAREARDKAHADGKIPALTAELNRAHDMNMEVRIHPIAGPLLNAEGHSEVSLFTRDPDTGVNLRARPDRMTNGGDRVTILDYKTAADANPATFGRTAEKWGYHIQFAWYVTVARLLKLDDNPAFLFVCQEKTPPYLVSVCELDGEAFDLGRRQMQQAIGIFKSCTDMDAWWGYGPEIHSVSLPPWAFSSNQPTIGELLDIERAS